MKKATVSAFIVSFLLLCSCTAQTTPEKICVNRNFSAKMTLHYKGAAYTADFVCDETGCNAVFLFPEEIKGLTLATDGDTVTYSLDGLKFESDINHYLPLDAIYTAITSTIQNAQITDSGYSLYGTNKYGDYIMNINNNFIPQFIECNDEEITVKFDIVT